MRKKKRERWFQLFFKGMLKLILNNIDRDVNFYGLPVVTAETCRNFQFSTDYGTLGIFYGNSLKK